jgi:dTDP-4-dehydrorhamnose 3,5-epimerase
MKVTSLEIGDVKLIETAIFRDDRGFLSEIYNRAALAQNGIDADFVQDNYSYSARRGTVRGLHFQAPPHAQGKLVRVVRGRVIDIAVDIRNGSPTYGRHVAAELSDINWRQMWVPAGFAHGFCTLEPDCEVIYKLTGPHVHEAECGLAWNDPALDIDWPVSAQRAVLSQRDRGNPVLADLPAHFRMGAP